MISFFIPGTPKPKGRPRFNPRTGRAYTPKETAVWERHVLGCWKESGYAQVDGPLVVTVRCAFMRPKSHYRADGHTLASGKDVAIPRSDVDNLAKPVLDALNGHAFADDRFVTTLTCTKEWVRDVGEEGVHVTLDPVFVLRHEDQTTE